MILLLSSLGVIILIAGLIATISLGGKSDSHYTTKTKGNVTRLTSLYVVLFIIAIIGFTIYLNVK